MSLMSVFRETLNLNWKKVTIQKITTGDKKIICEIRGKYSTTICPHCGTKTSKRQDQVLHEQKNNLKHMPYGGNKVIELKLFKRYFRCSDCQKRFYEKFGFESEHGMYTKNFEQYIQWNW